MQVINLADEWRVAIRNTGDVDVSTNDIAGWETMTLPLGEDFIRHLTPADRLWLRCTFMMPINEECSTWWLEADVILKGRVWVNGHVADNPDEGEIYQLEVTHYTALDENEIVLCLEPTHDLINWQALACVPYPCG